MNAICPEDALRLLLPAGAIPDGSTVSKRTGEVEMILKRNLKVYPAEKGGETMNIEGLFLVNDGNINQVKPDTLLHWHVTAEEFVDRMRSSWEGEPQ